ncbi:ABC transporter ATP-binding protein [Paramaledivibacter caminithermalis]|jgi:ABC-2 type transport system ATP-binding protein|uniref:ABC-2 type transport system ATP-binding protein n=1 Tax=Paramaledivibacter caminithermalis (strain DSM 15212 / CIP 107654 / DViRD3) TaxID=1121301 RepID=A0A1M6ML50_PARC5|nr:ABC transporter ATP-binding protein [Paramaledivibacter caminithermalis]SHJ84003.1 ABC-2 type transport system ATP-binding protein [Paramaledivibacter caminithermalis DSM 15212]
MVEIKSVSKSYDDVKAVDNVSLIIPDATFMGLLGPNGAGKTTLIRMLLGLIDSDEGRMVIDGEDVSRDNHSLKKKIGVVPQHINLDKELSVKENLIFSGLLYKMERQLINKRTSELLEAMNLIRVKDRVCKHLSGGMKRKLMIAKALIHDPNIIFLDEPSVGIDLKARREIWDILKRMNSAGKTILMTTHYIEEAEYLCDKVSLMNDGKIFYCDTPMNLIEMIGRFTVEYFENSLETKFKYFKTLELAKDFASKINDKYTIRDTTLEDVFYSFANRMVK